MLNLFFKKLDIDTINTISNWKYSESDSGFFMTPYQDSYQKDPDNLKGPGGCDGYGVYNNGQLFGLFEYKFVNNELEIGCALEPKVKSKGYGREFVLAGINFGITEYQYNGARIILSVDESNIAARKVYLKAGFKVDKIIGGTILMYKKLTYSKIK